jgi:AcrR family transcriptional regulator
VTKGSLPVVGQEPPKERADAQRNRQRVLDAARKLMKKRPLDAICMDEVAELAGVGKGTLYRRFADKTALLHALVDEDEAHLQERVRKRFLKGESVLSFLELLLDFHLDHAAILAAAESSAHGSARYENAPYVWRHTLLKTLLERHGVAKGEQAGHVADMLLATMSGVLLARALTTQTPTEVRAQCMKVYRALV